MLSKDYWYPPLKDSLKLGVLLVPVLFLFLTSPGRAMTVLGDDQLDLVFSQAGISINPDVTVTIHAEVIAWGDADGLKPGPYNPWNLDAAGGYIGVTDLHMEKVRVRLRTDPNDHYGGYDASTMCKPMTVDVGTRTMETGDRSLVRLGTGALEITSDRASLNVVLGPTP